MHQPIHHIFSEDLSKYHSYYKVFVDIRQSNLIELNADKFGFQQILLWIVIYVVLFDVVVSPGFSKSTFVTKRNLQVRKIRQLQLVNHLAPLVLFPDSMPRYFEVDQNERRNAR